MVYLFSIESNRLDPNRVGYMPHSITQTVSNAKEAKKAIWCTYNLLPTQMAARKGWRSSKMEKQSIVCH